MEQHRKRMKRMNDNSFAFKIPKKKKKKKKKKKTPPNLFLVPTQYLLHF
jgi:hypothetical protein